MCGIVGYYTNKIDIDSSVLNQMLRTLIHRGPDKQNTFIENNVSIGHARLSIIDLSDEACQPMISNNEQYVIAFNGEIYNFKEIAKKYSLTTKTNSDTEVILEAFALLGENIVNEFNGMFAIAIYDRHNESFTFFRDRIGKKPLFYFFDENLFAFASEIKALLANPYIKSKLSINYQAINYYLHLGYIPEPHSIYNEIKKFPSGHIGFFCKNHFEIKEYWNIEQKIECNYIEDREKSKNKLKELLTSSVQYRLISDVPYGIFLSGGIDSSLITAIAQQLTGNIKTFTIGFSDQKFNEAVYAKKIATYFKTDHTEYMVTSSDAFELIEEILDQYDEPFADSSALPTMLVSKLAKEKVTVILSGDGGDELFWGYGAYRWIKRLENPFVYKFRKPISLILNLGNSRYKRVAKLLNFNSNDFLPSHIFSQEQYFFTYKEIHNLLKQDFICKLNFKTLLNAKRKLTNIEIQSLFDFNYYLKDDLMVKVDRASMKYSVEVRCPLLDYRVVEFAYNLAPSLKQYKHSYKYILKELLYDYIPKRYFDRPKWGFAVPLNRWLQNELKEKMHHLLSKQHIDKYPFLNAKEIEKLVKNYHNGQDYLYGRIWNLMILISWFDKNYNQ